MYAVSPSTNVKESIYAQWPVFEELNCYALCSGHLRSGARWSHWEVETSCYDTEPSTDSNSDDTNKPRTKTVSYTHLTLPTMSPV